MVKLLTGYRGEKVREEVVDGHASSWKLPTPLMSGVTLLAYGRAFSVFLHAIQLPLKNDLGRFWSEKCFVRLYRCDRRN
jgi:hypothetical protein